MIRRGVWSNWAGNQRAQPSSVHRPRDADDVAAAVAYAHATGRVVTALGSGHSFTAVGRPDDVAIDCSGLSGVRAHDRAAGTVTVGAGTPLQQLNEHLLVMGLALPNLGDVAYQTISGAISTGTHGTGSRHRGIADQVVSIRLVDGNGTLRHLTGDDARTASVALGALGVLTEIELRVVPAFRLRAVECPRPVDRVLEELESTLDEVDFFEFYWVPHTPWALTKRNTITEEPPAPPSRLEYAYHRILMENVAFGAVCRVGRRVPALIPRLATVLPSSGRREWVDHSHRVFTSPRWVRFTESEWAIPRDLLPDALGAVRAMVDRCGLKLNVPVEVRFGAAESAPLALAEGRDSAYVAVHVFKGMSDELAFRELAAVMRDFGGRPHWGKVHPLRSLDLAPLYPRFDTFLALRDVLDPDGTFLNEYRRRVLGVDGSRP